MSAGVTFDNASHIRVDWLRWCLGECKEGTNAAMLAAAAAAAASSEEQQHRSLSSILLLLKQQYSTAQGTNVAADADSTILMLVLLKNFCCCFSSNDYILLRDNDTSMASQLELVQYCRRICWTNGFSQLHILHITLAYSAHFTSNILSSPILPLIYFLSRLLPILYWLSYNTSPTMPLLYCLSYDASPDWWLYCTLASPACCCLQMSRNKAGWSQPPAIQPSSCLA